MKLLSLTDFKNFTPEELRKWKIAHSQMMYQCRNAEYYKNYQINHYKKHRKQRLRTAKQLYYKKTHNKEIIFIRPPLNHKEIMKKYNLKIKYC